MKAFRYLAAGLILLAGLIHFTVAPEHFAEATEAGAFMIAVGTAQLLAAIALAVRPSRGIAAGILILTLAIEAIYAVSRTTGLPAGPHPGMPEEIGRIDVVSKAIEGALLVTLWPLLRRPRRVD